MYIINRKQKTKDFSIMENNLVKKLSKIAAAIQKAFKEELPLRSPKDLETCNSLPFLIWDCINTSLKELDGYETFEVRTARRGSWSFLLLFESESQTIITLIKKRRFEGIQKSAAKNIPKYLKELLNCLKNKDFIGDGAQYLLWDNEPDNKEFISAMERECLSFTSLKDLSEARHTFIVYDNFMEHLNSLSAIVVDNNFYQVGERIDMMDMLDTEMQLPLETVPAKSTEHPAVRLTDLAIKLREEKKLGN